MMPTLNLQGLGIVGFGASGKLTDEGGQGSSNPSYGPLDVVTAQDELNFWQPQLTIANGAQYGNATPMLRISNFVGLGAAALLFALGWKKTAGAVIALDVVDVVARQVSPNYDSAVSMFPFNSKVV